MAQPILEFRAVSGRGRKFHLSEITFSLYPGYIYAITGENGAGKTTLIHTIVHEENKYRGDILYQGDSIQGKHARIMQTIGLVSEEQVFFEDRSGEENAVLLGMLYDVFDRELFYTVMKTLHLPVGRIYAKMSRGERMKFQLAFAIAHGSRLFLMDEATAGLDPVFRTELFEMLRARLCDEKSCVLLTSHNTTEIFKNTDYVAVMQDGKLGKFTESMEGVAHGFFDGTHGKRY